MPVPKTLQRLRVPFGFIAAILFYVFCQPSWSSFGLGLPLVVIGTFIRFWAAGHIRKSREITISGPYRFTRNPLYLGSFIMGLGLAIQSGWVWLPFVCMVLFAMVYWPVMRQEERDLLALFGGTYDFYRSKVPLLFPLPGRSLPANREFSFRLAIRNREYNAPLGVLATEGVLVAKLFFHIFKFLRP